LLDASRRKHDAYRNVYKSLGIDGYTGLHVMVGGLVSTFASAACDNLAHVSVCGAEVLDAVKLSAKVSNIPLKNNVEEAKLGLEQCRVSGDFVAKDC
jgi:hypothetical protein